MNSRIVAAICLILGTITCTGCEKAAWHEKYTAEAVITIEPQKPSILKHSSSGKSVKEFDAKKFDIYKRTQAERVKSRYVILAALRKPTVAKIPIIKTLSDPCRWVQGILRISFPGDAEIMAIRCTMDDPHEAAVLVNAIAESYLSDAIKAERDTLQQRLNKLESAVTDKTQELRRARQELNNLAATFMLDNPKGANRPVPVDIEMLRSEIAAIEETLREVRMERNRAKIELAAPPRVTLRERAEDPITPDNGR